MTNSKTTEFIVGLFMLAGIFALVVLAFRVSGLSEYVGSDIYSVSARFDNIGSLKVRAPVSIAGVRVGQVTAISFDPKTFQAFVTMAINNKQNNIPDDSSASILTEGLLGSQYISLSPGFSEKPLHNGSLIENTHPALVLENLIGQFLYSVNKKDDDKGNDN